MMINKLEWTTLMTLAPSKRYLTRFPTISAGYTTSSKIPSWTAVRVLVRGRWTAEPFLGGLTILLVATKTTSCTSEAHLLNFIVSIFINIISEFKETPAAKQHVRVSTVMIWDKVQGVPSVANKLGGKDLQYKHEKKNSRTSVWRLQLAYYRCQRWLPIEQFAFI